MKSYISPLLLLALALTGCVVDQPGPPVTTTTTVTREVTTTGPVTGEVVVTRPPPVVRVERRTVSPGPNYVWTGGYWSWTGSSYVWVRGSWIRRPHLRAEWVPGHWVRRSRGWVFVHGHWR